MTPTPALSVRSRALVAATAALGALAIVGTPVQVDDPLFLAAARQIRATPFNPYFGKPVWYDGDWFAENANPPLWPYVLAATSAVCGENVVAFQIVQALLNVVLAFGIAALARRLSERPAFWTAAVLLSPFLLPGRNLMADTLFLACWCWAVEFFLQAAVDDKPRRAWLAGSFAGAALLTKYTGGLSLPLFFAATCLLKRPRLAPAFLVPTAMFAAWCLHNLIFYGRTHFGASVSSAPVAWLERSEIFLRTTGALVLWAPAFGAALATSRGGWKWLVVAAAVAASLAWFDDDRLQANFRDGQILLSVESRCWYAGMLSSGVLALVWGAAMTLRSRPIFDPPRLALFGWLTLGLLFNLIVASSVAFGAVRHLAVAYAPFVLLCARGLDEAARRTWLTRVVVWVVFVGQAALAGLLAHADRQAAATGPALRRLAMELSGQDAVWYAFDPALRFHLDGTNARPWSGAPDGVELKDWIVVPYSRSAPLRENRVLRERCRQILSVPIESWNRLQTQSEYASFYAGNPRTLPWRLQRSPSYSAPSGRLAVDEFLVYRRVD